MHPWPSPLSVTSQSVEIVVYFQVKPETMGGWGREEATPTFPVTCLSHTTLTPQKPLEHLPLWVLTLVAQLNLSLFADH